MIIPSDKTARRLLRASGLATFVMITAGAAAVATTAAGASTATARTDTAADAGVSPAAAHADATTASGAAISPAAADTTPELASGGEIALEPWFFGHSGKLRMRVVSNAPPVALPLISGILGDSVLTRPGVRTLPAQVAGGPFALTTLVPFSSKKGAALGGYRIGFWSAERRAPSSPMYAAPAGFIEVTRSNQELQVSENFRLRDFLTKDQGNVWPKYLVLRLELIDKLELIIDELRSQGIRVDRMHVMSGFRTPQYNQRGVGAGGRASESRHQYGDAADVFVDNNGNGRMDDINRDGRIDHRDAQVILDAAERVERRFPDLVGGAGLYRANASHGPFAHVDVRGQRARWGN